jgi:cell division protein FtsI (penicillin-binding protein 3)
MDSNVAKPDDMIDCQGGQITLAGRVIHDDKSDGHMGNVTVATALAKSSDVAAVKLALKVGQDRFYHYIRDFGFGARSGAELPGETRGLLRPPPRWNGSSIGSIAIGQEVGVTPLQLVSMVSTIANGGTYLPPRVLMPGQLDANGQKPAPLNASPFRVSEELPNPLPSGAHRVISEMAAAQMRKMMEGVVLFGSGKPAQLNGYSSGGKTGTAQKIDPSTHRYSKIMHIASFAGISPVNNPVIAVAVVMDNPKGASYYGTAVSAPVFAEVAQQVLEYLGVPHDEEIKLPKAKQKVDEPIIEDDHDGQADVDALYAAVNDLPADDPLRSSVEQKDPPATSTAQAEKAAQGSKDAVANLADKTPDTPTVTQSKPALNTQNAHLTTVAIESEHQIKVPLLVGLSMRKVIEAAASAGLPVEFSGRGTVREQAPAAGTLVNAGTHIVVRGSS